MSFDRARAIADAVLLEGYVLYPYRASSRKNRFRWAFGILAPRSWSEAGGCEPSWMETQTLLEPNAGAKVLGQLRFLQIEARQVEVLEGEVFRRVDALDVDGKLHLPWEEGALHEIPFELALPDDGPLALELPFEVAASRSEELVRDGSGVLRGRVVRERSALRGKLRVEGARVAAERPLWRLTVRVENASDGAPPGAPREQALRVACVSTHVLLAVKHGEFVSLLDPPEWAGAAAKSCKSTRCHPVLAGRPGQRDLVLASPIILYDHPQVAPESPGDLCDATEIDEILTLRTLMLTDDEKQQARATDPRAAAIVDRADALPPEHWEKLHGALRELHRAEMVPRVDGGLTRGSRVRLKPGRRRTDAQDLLFVGCVARVEAVMQDVDGRAYVAVTLEDDPAADFHRWYGRYQYYELDEIEPLPAEAAP